MEEEGPKDLVIPEEIIGFGTKNKKQDSKSKLDSKKSQNLNNTKDQEIRAMLEEEDKNQAKLNASAKLQDQNGGFFQKKSSKSKGSSYYSSNNPMKSIPEGDQKEYQKKLQQEEQKRFDFLMIRNMKLKVELKEASEVIDNLNRKERENITKENEIEPESDEIRMLNETLKQQQIHLNNLQSQNKSLKKDVDNYRNYNIEEKENDLYELNRLINTAEIERDSQLKVCHQQEKSFLIMKDDTLQQDTKKKLQEEQQILKKKAENKKRKIVLQDTMTRQNHSELIEKKSILGKMKLQVERRSKKTQHHISESIIVDEEDLAVQNQQITGLNQQKSSIGQELEEDKHKLGIMSGKLKMVNESLMAKLDSTTKEIKRHIIMMNEFKRFKKEEAFKKKERAKKEAKQIDDTNFEMLKHRMREEKLKKRKNPVYGGLDHLPEDSKYKILNDGGTELITDRQAGYELKGEYLFTASQDRHLKMWEVSTGKQYYDYGEIEKEKVNAITIDKTNNILYTAGMFGIKKWNILTKEIMHEWQNLHERQISSVILTEDCQYLISGGYDERLIKINLETNEKELVCDSLQTGGIMTVAICNDPENNYLYTSGPDGRILKMHMSDFQQASELQIYDAYDMSKKLNAHDDMVQAMSLAGEGKVLVTGGFDKKLKIWNVKDDKCIQEKLSAHTDYIISMMVSTNTYDIFTGSADQKLKKWKLEFDQDENTYKLLQIHSYGNVDCVYSMCLSNKDKYLFTGGQEKAVKQWNMKNDKLYRNFGYIHKSTITGLAVAGINIEESEDEQENVEEEEIEQAEEKSKQEEENEIVQENGEDTQENIEEPKVEPKAEPKVEPKAEPKVEASAKDNVKSKGKNQPPPKLKPAK